MSRAERAGRPNQKARTRKDILQAAARLTRRGRTPTLEEVAEDAMISRATVYRYFPSIEALLVEAAVDVAVPDPDELFRGDGSVDPVARLERVEASLNDVILENETLLCGMLALSIRCDPSAKDADALPRRQNRRTPLIEAALEPARDQFRPSERRLLENALALIMGPESTIVVKDVLQLDEAQARKVKRWTIRALVEAARKPVARD